MPIPKTQSHKVDREKGTSVGSPGAQEATTFERRRMRPMEASEALELADSLALAFRDNPLNRAAIRGSAARRVRSNRYGMRATLAAAVGRATILVPAIQGGAGLGGLIALAPGGWPLPPPPVFAQLEYWFGQGVGALRRWGKVYHALAALHPAEPHWYLELLGVAPEAQGRGIGAGLLEKWLQDVDREGGSAYLETDRLENIGFYNRVGFEVVGTEEILGTPIWRMGRPPR